MRVRPANRLPAAVLRGGRTHSRPFCASRRDCAAASLLLLLLAAAWLARTPAEALARAASEAAQTDDVPPASTVVEPHAYVSLAPVPRGRTFDLAVVARIRPGFHINAHEASADYLIPTTLEASLPLGIRALETIYPPGIPKKFEFSDVKLSVYKGSVTLRMRLLASAETPLGPQKLPLLLRYQACSEEACLPPVKIPVTAELEIAPAGAPARPANPAIFHSVPPAKTRSPR